MNLFKLTLSLSLSLSLLGSSSIQAENLDQNFQNFSIEEEVEKCIMRLFKTSSLNAPSNPYDRLGVEEFADILAKFKDSHEKKEKVKEK